MKSLPLSKILQPVTTISRLLGMNPCVLNKHKFVYSTPKLLQTITMGSTCLFLTIYYFYNFANITYSKYGSRGVMQYVMSFRLIASIVKMFFVLVLSRNIFATVTHAMQNLTRIDYQLTKFNLKQYLERRNWEIRRMGIVFQVVINLIFNTLGSVFNAYCKTSGSVVYFLVSCYPMVVVSTHIITLVVMTLVLKARFEAINEALATKIRESKKCQSYPDVNDFRESLDDLVFLHKGLVNVSEEVYGNFSPLSLLWIVLMFVILTCDSYALLHMMMYEQTKNYWNIVFGLIKNCTNYVIHLYYLAKTSNDLCQEAQATKIVILGVQIDITKETDRNCVIASVLQLMENKLEITAWKLFNIDNALLFSICGAVFSYLFIVLQLDRSATAVAPTVPTSETNISSPSN